MRPEAGSHPFASLPMPQFEQSPQDAPAVAGKRGGEIAAYKPVPEDPHAEYSGPLQLPEVVGALDVLTAFRASEFDGCSEHD